MLACNGCRDGNSAPAIPSASATLAGSAGRAAAGSPTTPPADAAPTGAETVVRLEDDGKTFDVARSSTVTFKLASRGGTGYAWLPTQVDAVALAQQGERTTELSSDTPGAPKLDVFRFTAIAPGSTSVEMSLRRAFGGAPPARVMRVVIQIR